MSRHIPLLAIFLIASIVAWGWFRAPSASNGPAVAPAPAAISPAPTFVEYTTGPASPDGIGKFFHGREIAQVMGHPAIGWLERTEREQEEAPSKAIAAIDLAPDAVLADIGAGSGYYSFRLSEKVPKGRIVAVDIQPEMLDFLRKKSAELGITNVEPHLGTIEDVKLPAASLDAALMVDSYHEFSHPREMLASLRHALKPGGRIFLLEFRGEDPRVPIKPLHKMTEAQARLELESAGFRFVSNLRPLPWQHFMIFERP
ncbi:MAG: class I SAM-dependent methyltransferase [Akkermansiaceae bacterium]|jgi:SAM-dependent methyltransferase|nr:class I SAM-dependent methyltransferase [Akkermansiaceae bacterium]